MDPIAYAKAYLSNRAQELTERLAGVERSRQRDDGTLSADAEERATECENDEVLDHLSDVTRVELAQVRRAMERIDKGEYGLCEHCGQPIEEARLLAVPEVTGCRACARARIAA
ncbi:MAG: TraR/DksA C4-type zinc finger protein [Nevskia sp.]|nr:TraR/DksA C4-type zinc finger protein [Nevskia sp.]